MYMFMYLLNMCDIILIDYDNIMLLS